MAGANTDQATPMSAYTATFTIKQLALQVFSIRPPDVPIADSVQFGLPGNWDDVTFQIWPIENAIQWPSRFFLDDAALDLLKDRWMTLSEPP